MSFLVIVCVTCVSGVSSAQMHRRERRGRGLGAYISILRSQSNLR